MILLSPPLFTISDISAKIKDRYVGEVKIIARYGLLSNDIADLLLYRDEYSLIRNFGYGEAIIFKNNAAKQVKNIICIQVESLDANIINFKYKGKYITPFLHRLSSQCVYYPYMLVYILAGVTSDTEFATLNGAIPLDNFPTMKLRNYIYPNSIIKRLSKFNYISIAFHNNFRHFFNRDMAYFKMGFKEFYDLEKMKLREYGWGAADHDVMGYVNDMLKEQKSPFLYYIITMSSHPPYNLVKSYYSSGDYEDIDEQLVRDYFYSMSYVDGVLENFITFIQNNVKDSCIFIFGDHPPNNNFKSLFRKSALKLDNRLLRSAPLFIITPDNQKYIENNKVVSVLDLAPTILYASGISFEIMAKGVNLLDFPIRADSVPITNMKMRDRKQLFNIFNKLDKFNEFNPQYYDTK